jgi:hypothetical protein
MDDYYTVSDLVRLTGLSRQRIDQLMGGARLPFRWVGPARIVRRDEARRVLGARMDSYAAAQRAEKSQGKLL